MTIEGLLAIIHGDGGHHTAKVGLEQSLEDAKNKYYELLGKVAYLEKRIALYEGAEQCESCGKLIFPEEDRYNWEDGIVTCFNCGGPVGY